MNSSRERVLAVAFVVVLALVALPALPANADEYSDKLEKGKSAFVSQCLNCHQTVDDAAGGYRTRSAWQKIVTDMVARGSQLDEGQQETVIEYLAGRMLLVAKCSSCHTYYRPLVTNKSLEKWRITVKNMVQRMPPALQPTPEEIDRLSVFLAVERPAR